MNRTIWVGAVAYDPKVVTIWEGMRRYFHEEARLSVEVVLFQSYETQVSTLLATPSDLTPCIDIAWNTNLAYLQADAWSDHRCRPIAMRDTDIGWATKIIAPTGVRSLRLPILEIAPWRLAAATVVTPRFSRFIFWSGKACSKDSSTARCASTPTSVSMVIQARASRSRPHGPRRSRRCRCNRQSVLEMRCAPSA